MSEADEIARFLAEHGVTRCPTAYAVPTQAAKETAADFKPVKYRGGWAQPGGKNHRNLAVLRRIYQRQA